LKLSKFLYFSHHKYNVQVISGRLSYLHFLSISVTVLPSLGHSFFISKQVGILKCILELYRINYVLEQTPLIFFFWLHVHSDWSLAWCMSMISDNICFLCLDTLQLSVYAAVELNTKIFPLFIVQIMNKSFSASHYH